ncbi:hypothetical protein L917_00471 [Phytophthora nicotianae]|uniref:Uncharacterized protein n=4 Tax=Phytophthora nicotianae TaxID=4792 RepID=W2RHB0_PHYN3|nr:hypothetical protein PPTG_20737 [Phytophthora nicotianae INRA-310]ETI57114.1 hypothetical protein F443_00521 [Phytophthora nicotianae P1569]ETL50223.1 hypothetical protein L916_00500 [Phytophthora nicotianae]ETO85850.1 hypothetical protein F444_00518 [Phytophthora nicotianae P1976]ETM03276.1 hypothetical protein L917_00471 [Phytophthora nicotianae]ETM56536.1 hypothetical protein L914_00490 [Phytophthora nicotianae]
MAMWKKPKSSRAAPQDRGSSSKTRFAASDQGENEIH